MVNFRHTVVDSEMQLAGYEMFRKDQDKAKGGGVLLYVKYFLALAEFHTSVTFHNQVWCKTGDLCISVCYRSSNTGIKGSDNNEHLLELITEVGNKHILLMSDFNVPNVNWVSHTPTSVADSYTKSFIMQHFTTPTRENTVLDLIFSKELDLVSNVDFVSCVSWITVLCAVPQGGLSSVSVLRFKWSILVSRRYKKGSFIF